MHKAEKLLMNEAPIIPIYFTIRCICRTAA